MENASKALIIAGAVLVSIMIISLGVYIFNITARSARQNIENKMSKQEIASFNAGITPYLGQSVPGSQVNALIQYVISNDMKCIQTGETFKAITIEFEYEDGNYNTIKLSDDNSSVNYGNGKKRVETGSNKYYEVNGTYDSNGLITTITVEE